MAAISIDPFDEFGFTPTPKTAREAAIVVDRLSSLAPWLIRREVLELASLEEGMGRARRSRFERMARWSRLPRCRGAANVIFIARDESRAPDSPLRPACFLPLRWVKGADDSPGLPAALRGLAVQVRADMKDKLEDHEEWGLRFNGEYISEELDLSSMKVGADSAWASLATALLLATWRVLPRNDVAMSGAWTGDRGLIEVEGLEAKMKVAREFGCILFYASSKEADRSTLDVPAGLDLRFYSEGDSPFEILHPSLREFAVAPTRKNGDKLEIRQKYANHLFTASWQDKLDRELYAMENLSEDLAEEMRAKNPEARELAKVENLVLTLSSPSAQVLTTLVARPARTLVFFTDDPEYRRAFDLYREHCPAPIRDGIVPAALPGDSKEDPSTRDRTYGMIQQRIHEFLASARDGSLSAVDITGGTKGMTAAALLAACRAGAVMFHVDSIKIGANNAFGTEKVRFVREIDPKLEK